MICSSLKATTQQRVGGQEQEQVIEYKIIIGTLNSRLVRYIGLGLS